MKKIIFSIFILLILVSPSMAQEVGKLTALQGKVDIMREGKPPAFEAKINQPVFPKDIIRTKTNSKAEITFRDGTIIKIAQRSRVDISEYFTDGDILKARLELQRGRVGAYVSKESVEKIRSSPKANRFEIKTPIAVAGVRGTNFIVSHDINLTTTILVISGKVYAYNIDLPDQIVELHDGEMTIIREKNPPTPPMPATPEDISRFQVSLNLESLSPPVSEIITVLEQGHSSIINMNSSIIWADNLEKLQNTGIYATFSGDAFWRRTPAKVFLIGQIIDSDNQVNFSSGKGYLWSGDLNGQNSQYKYAGYIGGALVPKADNTYNMNAHIAGIYSDSSNEKGVFIGYLGKDGSSNISLTDKSFSLEGNISSAVSLGMGTITGQSPPYILPENTNVSGDNLHREAKFDGKFILERDSYTFGVFRFSMGGSYDHVPQQNWYIHFQTPPDFTGVTGGIVHGSLWGNENNMQNLIKGKTYGYFIDQVMTSTGIFVGETIGTFNPNSSYNYWQTVTVGVVLETNTFLNLVGSDTGKQKLSSIGVPVVEVGKVTLSYNQDCTNCITSVTMSDVTFFATSMGNPPTIWATKNVNGNFNGTVPINEHVTLSGGRILVEFKPIEWTSNYWKATVSGSGSVGNYNINKMCGVAAGNISGNDFSGTAAGAVREAVRAHQP